MTTTKRAKRAIGSSIPGTGLNPFKETPEYGTDHETEVDMTPNECNFGSL
ncbi:MAG: hypothetical protein JEZ12_10975 [Desulfobacterium sp.]|nr:hypothetical protein [Desulfobacterium sp.]